MSSHVITEDEATLLSKISEDMEESGIGSVVITRGDKLVGMVTDRDIASKVVMKNKKASEMEAKEIMCSPLITIGPGTPLEKACGIMAAKGIRRMPVMDDNKLLGIISVRNILTRAPGQVKEFYPRE